MAYTEIPEYEKLIKNIVLLTQLKAEHGALGLSPILKDTERALQAAIKALEELPGDAELAKAEPDDLAEIKALRPDGPRRISRKALPN